LVAVYGVSIQGIRRRFHADVLRFSDITSSATFWWDLGRGVLPWQFDSMWFDFIAGSIVVWIFGTERPRDFMRAFWFGGLLDMRFYITNLVTLMWPNTALEPTAIRVVSSAVADGGLFCRGSAFGR
jgi:hypothetical protein